MSTYIFATVRGEDFEIEEDSPIDAYLNLKSRGPVYKEKIK